MLEVLAENRLEEVLWYWDPFQPEQFRGVDVTVNFVFW